MLKKIIWILLVVVLASLLLGLVFWLVWDKGWPWWMGLALIVGILGIVAGIFFLKRYLLRRREAKFVQRVVELDQAAIGAAPIHERQQLQDLQEKWRASIELLRDSYLQKRGNPLYALPWFLMIGESGTGKTSAISKSRLRSPVTEPSRTAGIAATRNCDWWFFDQAIILDTAGRYTIPIEEGADREEWEKFLVLLSKYRRKEPLNGVIVAIPADKLLQSDENVLRSDGQGIRLRIDQLMRILGAKFPVYILVTKMDLVHGFLGFSDTLPEGGAGRAMGFINKGLNPYWREVLDEAMNSISRRLRDLCPLLIYQAGLPDPGAVLFPNEFLRLRPGLEIFLRAAFEENPYQETPLFRGIFYSSAQQAGQPQSEFLGVAGIDPAIAGRKATDRSIFLHELFAAILPADRNLYRPIREFIKWRRVTQSLGLFAWVMVWVFLCGLLSFSFVHNAVTIGKFREEFFKPPTLTRDIAQDLYVLNKMRLEILFMEETNRHWWIPRFGLDDSLAVEERLKEAFVKAFREEMLNSFHIGLSRKMEAVTRHTPENIMAAYTGYLVEQLRLLKGFLDKGKLPPAEAFKKMSTELIELEYPNIPPGVAPLFGEVYCAYVTWMKDRTALESRVKLWQVTLMDLQKRGDNLRWLVQKWIPDAAPVSLADIWGTPEGAAYPEDIYVPGAYTERGRKHIAAFIGDMEAALTDKALLAQRKKDFWQWYQEQFYEAWGNFARDFSTGRDGIESQERWQQAGAAMTTEHNPYFLLLERMAEEMANLDRSEAPPWVLAVMELHEVRKLAKAEEQAEKPSLAGKIKAEEQKALQQVQKVNPQEMKELERRLDSVKLWRDYRKALDQMAPLVINPEMSFRACSEYFLFQGNPADAQPLFTQAQGSYVKLRGTLPTAGGEAFLWDIVSGPLNFLIDYSMLETACYLQAQWSEQVLGGIRGTSKEKAAQILFDQKDGLVWKFLEGPAKPFVKKDRKGYLPREANKNAIPFHDAFFRFIKGGAERVINFQPDYYVKMESIPIETNAEAKVMPYGNVLSVQCAAEKTVLKNYNYPQKKTFHWRPDRCGDVTLQILLPDDLVLTRVYEGDLGFAKFLQDFQSGSRTFKAAEFPDQEKTLARLGISWIRVSYVIADYEPAVQLLKEGLKEVPAEIVYCWSR